MRYFLKKDLPGIKAGAEMEKVTVTQTKNTFANGHTFRPGQWLRWLTQSSSAYGRKKTRTIGTVFQNPKHPNGSRRGMPKNGDVFFMPDLEREDENPVKLSWSHHPYD